MFKCPRKCSLASISISKHGALRFFAFRFYHLSWHAITLCTTANYISRSIASLTSFLSVKTMPNRSFPGKYIEMYLSSLSAASEFQRARNSCFVLLAMVRFQKEARRPSSLTWKKITCSNWLSCVLCCFSSHILQLLRPRSTILQQHEFWSKNAVHLIVEMSSKISQLL